MYKLGNFYKVNPKYQMLNTFLKEALKHNCKFKLIVFDEFDKGNSVWQLMEDLPSDNKESLYKTIKPPSAFIPYIKNFPQDIEGGNI